jgi:hypothetical protein
MVASSLDARVLTQIGKDRMKLSLDLEAIRARRDSFSSSEAQSETLCGVLRSGPSEQESGEWFVQLSSGTSNTSTACAACLLAIRPEDHTIAATEGRDNGHLVAAVLERVAGVISATSSPPETTASCTLI